MKSPEEESNNFNIEEKENPKKQKSLMEMVEFKGKEYPIIRNRVVLKYKNLPVVGGKIISEIDGKEIVDCYNIEPTGDGFNGIVKIHEKHFPVIEGTLIDNINGEKIVDCSLNIKIINNKINGAVDVSDQKNRMLPVIDNELITCINDNIIEQAWDIENINGKPNGIVQINGKRVPVINGMPVFNIGPNKIEGCWEVKNVNNELNGKVEVGKKIFPVINGEIITHIGKYKIENCSEVENIENKFNGIILVDCGTIQTDFRRVPVIAGEPIFKIRDGKRDRKIEDCKDFKNINGLFNGVVLIGRKWLPVIDEKFVELEINGEKIEIEHFENLKNVDGKLNGIVKIKNRFGKFPVIAGKIITYIGGKKIDDCFEAENINDKLNGLVEIGGFETKISGGIIVV